MNFDIKAAELGLPLQKYHDENGQEMTGVVLDPNKPRRLIMYYDALTNHSKILHKPSDTVRDAQALELSSVYRKDLGDTRSMPAKIPDLSSLASILADADSAKRAAIEKAKLAEDEKQDPSEPMKGVLDEKKEEDKEPEEEEDEEVAAECGAPSAFVLPSAQAKAKQAAKGRGRGRGRGRGSKGLKLTPSSLNPSSTTASVAASGDGDSNSISTYAGSSLSGADTKDE
eukprot:6458175-Amphidinium_carterae.2